MASQSYIMLVAKVEKNILQRQVKAKARKKNMSSPEILRAQKGNKQLPVSSPSRRMQ